MWSSGMRPGIRSVRVDEDLGLVESFPKPRALSRAAKPGETDLRGCRGLLC
jgi:hypothetical protein